MSAIRTFALATVAAAALAVSAQAQTTTAAPRTRAAAGQRARGQHGEKMFKNLDLTAAQKTQVKAIRAKYKTQFKASRDQAKPYMDAARAARQKGDTAAFRANMEKARSVSSGARAQEMNEIRGVLTADQRTKLDAAIAQRKQNAGNHGARRAQWKKGNKTKIGS